MERPSKWCGAYCGGLQELTLYDGEEHGAPIGEIKQRYSLLGVTMIVLR